MMRRQRRPLSASLMHLPRAALAAQRALAPLVLRRLTLRALALPAGCCLPQLLVRPRGSRVRCGCHSMRRRQRGPAVIRRDAIGREWLLQLLGEAEPPLPRRWEGLWGGYPQAALPQQLRRAARLVTGLGGPRLATRAFFSAFRRCSLQCVMERLLNQS